MRIRGRPVVKGLPVLPDAMVGGGVGDISSRVRRENSGFRAEYDGSRETMIARSLRQFLRDNSSTFITFDQVVL